MMDIAEETRFKEKKEIESDAVDEYMAGISERTEQSLAPLKEDLAEWLKRLLDVEINLENFLDDLDNGVLVCRVAKAVQKAAEDWINSGQTNTDALPSFPMKFHQNAKAGTFFARDNASHFLEWCKEIGVQKSVMFESDGLVLQKQPRNVILCLLDVARIASRYGIEPPGLVKLENEIDEEIRCEEQKKEPTPKPLKKERKVSKPNLNLNEEVFRLAGKYGVRIERIQEGRYIVDGKINIFVRILRNHIMVRVGGGWDTLDHFLSRHDPNRVGKILTSTPQPCPHHHGRGS